MPFNSEVFSHVKNRFCDQQYPNIFHDNPTFQDALAFIKETHEDVLSKAYSDSHIHLSNNEIASITGSIYDNINWLLYLAHLYQLRDVPVANNAHPENEN